MSGGAAFQFPADLKKAQIHRLAHRLFKDQDQIIDDDERNDVCQCCNTIVGKKNYKQSFCYSPTKKLAFLGPGAPLFFVFIQNALMYLVSFTLIFVIYSITTNVQGQSCNKINNCINDIFNSMSLSNKIDDTDGITIQIYLISGFLLTYILLKQYLIFRIRKKQDQYDQKLKSPSDFSIIIKGLPENVKEQDIKKMIEEKRKELTQLEDDFANKLDYKKIILSYDLTDYLQKKKEQEERFKLTKKKNQHDQYTPTKIAAPFKTGHFAIVIFEKQISKQIFKKGGFKQHLCKIGVLQVEQGVEYEVRGKKVIVKRAPEPDDVLWENAHITNATKYKNIILAFILGVIILSIGAYIQYYLKYFDYKAKYTPFGDFYAYLSPIILFIYDQLIVQMLTITTQFQGHQTQTDLHRSLLRKLCYYSFFNVGVFFLISQFFAYKATNFNLSGNFAFDLVSFFVIKTLNIPIVKFLKTRLELPTSIKRFMLRNGYFKCTQKQANYLYELKPFNFAIKYSFIVKTIWITVFYAPFLPILVPIAMIGLIFYYFFEKELLRTSYKRPNMVTAQIAFAAGRLLDYAAPILFAGQLLILIYIKYNLQGVWHDWTINEIASMAICFVSVVFIMAFPAKKINEKLFPLNVTDKKANENDNGLKQRLIETFGYKLVQRQATGYQQAALNFEKTYEKTNPYKQTDETEKKKINRIITNQ